MKIMQWLLAAAWMLASSGPAQAAPAGRALVLIEPEHYAYQTKLWHFYYDYWFSQGEALEPLALEALRPLFAEVGMCRSNEAADVIVWLKPRLFYNPHMTVFYATLGAQVFSGSGRLLGEYRGYAQHHGFLDVVPAQQVQAAYRLALQDLVRQMQSDAALEPLRMHGLPDAETRSPCGVVSVLPPAK